MQVNRLSCHFGFTSLFRQPEWQICPPTLFPANIEAVHLTCHHFVAVLLSHQEVDVFILNLAYEALIDLMSVNTTLDHQMSCSGSEFCWYTQNNRDRWWLTCTVKVSFCMNINKGNYDYKIVIFTSAEDCGFCLWKQTSCRLMQTYNIISCMHILCV